MRLSDFIRQSSDAIVAHSVEFARTLEPMSNQTIDVQILRNHLPLVLEAIAADLEQVQTRAGGPSITTTRRARFFDDFIFGSVIAAVDSPSPSSLPAPLIFLLVELHGERFFYEILNMLQRLRGRVDLVVKLALRKCGDLVQVSIQPRCVFR